MLFKDTELNMKCIVITLLVYTYNLVKFSQVSYIVLPLKKKNITIDLSWLKMITIQIVIKFNSSNVIN